MGFINRLSYKFSSVVSKLDVENCLIIVACVLVVGLLCMRGFGSRTDY